MKRSAITLTCCALSLACNDSINQAPVQTEAGITATYRMAVIDSLAKLCGRGLVLMQITGKGIRSLGTSPIWYYDFQGTVPPYAAYRFHATASAVAFEGHFTMGVGIGPIDRSWFDSNFALDIAEKNGGGNFRNLHPGCTIDASLSEPALGTRTTFWQIRYHPVNVGTRVLLFSVDANTGSVSMGYEG